MGSRGGEACLWETTSLFGLTQLARAGYDTRLMPKEFRGFWVTSYDIMARRGVARRCSASPSASAATTHSNDINGLAQIRVCARDRASGCLSRAPAGGSYFWHFSRWRLRKPRTSPVGSTSPLRSSESSHWKKEPSAINRGLTLRRTVRRWPIGFVTLGTITRARCTCSRRFSEYGWMKSVDTLLKYAGMFLSLQSIGLLFFEFWPPKLLWPHAANVSLVFSIRVFFSFEKPPLIC